MNSKFQYSQNLSTVTDTSLPLISKRQKKVYRKCSHLQQKHNVYLLSLLCVVSSA